MLRIVILLGMSALLALGDGPVLKTGQTNSYDEAGNIVTDGSIKDDGFYRQGRAVSYTKGFDTVADHATGLVWQDDESITKRWVTSANYIAGNYFDTSGDTATTYCSELPLNSASWRLPTIQELQTLVDYGQYNPSTTADIFTHLETDTGYWSSTPSASTTGTTTYEDNALSVSFLYGSVSGGNDKDWPMYVRCVKDGNLQSPSLSRNADTKIVTDSATGLQWQDDSEVNATKRVWTDSIDYCEELELGGDTDWRMPNVNEMFSITDYSRRPAIDTSVFVNTEITATTGFWTSTTKPDGTEWVYRVFEAGLIQASSLKTFSLFVRCVRGGDSESGGSYGFIPPIVSFILFF